MNTKERAVASSPIESQKQVNCTISKRPGKLISMLEVFATGIRLQRFQAARDYADSVLNTTVSDLHKTYGVNFSRKWVTVRNRFGTDTRVMLYWLTEQEQFKARTILGLTRLEAA